MIERVLLDIPNLSTVELQIDPKESPNTVKSFLDSLPFTVELNIWGEEIYSSECPLEAKEENAKSLLKVNDVAFWPPGKAICLFYGSTPIGDPGEIKPYSPVNVIGKITNPDKSILKKIKQGTKATFQES